MGTLATRKTDGLLQFATCNKLSIKKYFKGIPTSKSSSSGVRNTKEIPLLQLQHDP
jgi:hypothetical protein